MGFCADYVRDCDAHTGYTASTQTECVTSFTHWDSVRFVMFFPSLCWHWAGGNFYVLQFFLPFCRDSTQFALRWKSSRCRLEKWKWFWTVFADSLWIYPQISAFYWIANCSFSVVHGWIANLFEFFARILHFSKLFDLSSNQLLIKTEKLYKKKLLNFQQVYSSPEILKIIESSGKWISIFRRHSYEIKKNLSRFFISHIQISSLTLAAISILLWTRSVILNPSPEGGGREIQQFLWSEEGLITSDNFQSYFSLLFS